MTDINNREVDQFKSDDIIERDGTEYIIIKGEKYKVEHPKYDLSRRIN